MPSHCTLTVRIFQPVHKERRIAHDGIKKIPLSFFHFHQFLTSPHQMLFRKILQGAARYPYPVGKRTGCHILPSLHAGIRINIYSPNLSLRETLRHHERDKSRTRPDVEYTLSTLSPCTQQHPVGAHLHRTAILLYFKLFKCKSSHKSSLVIFYFPKLSISEIITCNRAIYCKISGKRLSFVTHIGDKSAFIY